MTEAQPTGPEPNRKRDPIADFYHRYGICVEDARKAKEAIDAEAWQAIYHERVKKDRERRRSIALDIATLSQALEVEHLDDKQLKSLSALRADAREVRTAFREFEAWVDEFTEPARRARDLIAQFTNKAQRLEDAAPLHNAGMVALMEDAIAGQPSIHWNASKGIITIEE